jgi:hypothetical protein
MKTKQRVNFENILKNKKKIKSLETPKKKKKKKKKKHTRNNSTVNMEMLLFVKKLIC